MKKVILYISLFIFSISVFAQKIQSYQSEIMAKNFIKAMPHIFNEDFSIASMDSIAQDNLCLFRIYKLSPKGFIVLSANENTYPVVAFSNDGIYSGEEMPGINLFMKKWITESVYALQNSNTKSEIKQMWNDLRDGKNIFAEKQNRSVSPLLTCTWNQGYPYNINCPADAEGPGGYTYAGCVATAMGQILYYHRWPLSGIGSYSYTHPEYGEISADFSAAQYNWNEMVNKTTIPNNAIALLLHHLGVAVDMDYGPNGSGMWNHSAAFALRTYFKCVPETRYIFRDSTNLNWDSLVITNLQDKKPLYYAGWEDTTYTMGHAFVCDGYETNDYYHFNWGWGGSYNGFFYTGQLNPGGSNFNMCQELIVDIFPDTNLYTYPLFCSGSTELTQTSGTITDGSGIYNYPSNSDCSWWIHPECGSVPEITFDCFTLSDNDTLFIFEGSPSQHYLVSWYNGSNQPVLSTEDFPTKIQTDSGEFYIEFHSNDTSDGFNLSYNTTYCSTDTISDYDGYISDGSGPCDYRKSTSCKWIFNSPETQTYYFTTNEFNLYPGSITHSVQFYKESISSGNLVYKFTTENPPPANFNIVAPSLIVRFLSTTTGTGSGWDFSFQAAPLNSNYLEENPSDIFYPNPSDQFIYAKNFEEESQLEILNTKGSIVKKCILNNENSKIDVSNLDAGVYFFKTISRDKVSTEKIIIY